MDLDFLFEGKNTSNVGVRSKISISSRANGKKAEDRDKRERHLSTYDIIDKDYGELFLYSTVSPRRKSMPSGSIATDFKDGESLKRGSMYRSSKELRRIRNARGSRNVQSDHSNDVYLSFKVIDSSPLDASKEFVFFPQPTKELKSTVDGQLFRRENHELLELSFRDLSDEFSEISISCFPTEERGRLIGKEALEKIQVKEIKFSTHQLLSAGVDTNIGGKDSPCAISDPLSAKVGSSNTSFHGEREFLKSSSKTLLSSFKKMLDPIMKSKPLPNAIILEPETNRSTPDALRSSRLKLLPKSLMNDFSREAQKTESVQESTGSDQAFKIATSFAYLHAVLKWDPNHDPPLYEFFVKEPEDVLCAKIWKTENSFNWAYTFHRCKKRSKGCSHGKKDRHNQLPSMIAQMQVSCYLCSDVSGAGSFENSAVTEFTLYDIDLARRNNAIERYHLPLNFNQTAISAAHCPSEANSLSLAEKEDYRSPVRHDSPGFDSEPSTSYPWAPSELKPNLEIAAIVIQIPFIKKGDLKILEAGDKYSSGHQKARTISGDHSNFAEVKVVTPMGRHGLPNSEEVGPSSLLDRWRFGGGCECGGWDMGCPILVFDTVNSECAASVIGTQQPIVLLSKGKKEKAAALTITSNGEGQYAVDFHAQLSALQAFSICIAILHGSEASTAIGQDKNNHKLYSDSLKLLLEDEVRHIIEAISEEEKRKSKKIVEQVPPSFFLDPPFSPIGRV